MKMERAVRSETFILFTADCDALRVVTQRVEQQLDSETSESNAIYSLRTEMRISSFCFKRRVVSCRHITLTTESLSGIIGIKQKKKKKKRQAECVALRDFGIARQSGRTDGQRNTRQQCNLLSIDGSPPLKKQKDTEERSWFQIDHRATTRSIASLKGDMVMVLSSNSYVRIV